MLLIDLILQRQCLYLIYVSTMKNWTNKINFFLLTFLIEIYFVPIGLFKYFLRKIILFCKEMRILDKSSLMRTIGNNIREYRKLRGLTQEQLAERVGISPSFCANIERGNKGVSLVVIKNISEVLEVSVDRLMSADEEYDYIQDVITLLNGKPKQFIIAIEQIVRVCAKEFLRGSNKT